ncbi:MAG: hypothetical protein P4L93_03250 [Coriobacteriia bacterium]|nr:hypothetical protein [Coriobacteriia bacterium]
MSLGMPPAIFFAYPSRPALRRTTVSEAAEALTETGEARGHTWESLSIGGRLIIAQITTAIDGSVLSVFDTTEPNENVLFELGYAIGAKKRVWLIRDRSFAAATRQWDKFALLSPIGYVPYSTSGTIVNAFLAGRPHEAMTTVYDDLVANSLVPDASSSVLYLASPHDTNASYGLTRALERERSSTFTLAVVDPQESVIQPLSWYAESIAASRGVVAHFTSPKRQDGEIHNARMALLSGLARGMGKELLMLAEEDYSTPIDYQDALFVYSVPRDVVARVNRWLRDHKRVLEGAHPTPQSEAFKRAAELRSLRLGSHVAEDEAASLSDYFVETRPYTEVLQGGVRLFVGRKGAGKTANLLHAAADLSADARNVVCVIKPPAYELGSLLRLLRRYKERDEKGFLIESMWKYLLWSELARTATSRIREQRAVVVPATPEWNLLEAVANERDLVLEDFSIRLERAVEDLLPIDVETGVAAGRVAISEALHETRIRHLVGLLAEALSGKHRVAILVDNLDKAWTRDSDLGELSQFVLGLLGAMRSIGLELEKRGKGRQPLGVSLAVFLRSDIYSHVTRMAREPDKLAVSRLDWSDRDLLLRVLEERYTTVSGANGTELWTRLFCAFVDFTPTREWFFYTVLPRPRDMLYLANASITNAVNRRRDQVQPDDLKDARFAYSTYAFESLLVEGEPDLPQMESVLYEFAASSSVQSETQVLERIRRGLGRKATKSETSVLTQLLELSFLGFQSAGDHPVYVDNPAELTRNRAIAHAKLNAAHSEMQYSVHPAFRAFLEVRETLVQNT